MKQCSQCSELKPTDEFYKKPASRSGFNAECKTCSKAMMRKWAAENKESLRITKTRWNYANRHITRKSVSDWSQRNPDKRSRLQGVRRAQQVSATPTWSNPVLVEEMYRFAQQLTKDTGVFHVVDHVVPLRSQHVCGLNSHTNLQVLTQLDNSLKGNRFWPDMSIGE